MTNRPDWQEVKAQLDALYSASDKLELMFPGRKFSLDGHLVGSVGEVVAAYMFDLKLNPASTAGFDAVSGDGKNVEIKLTQGRQVALRDEPDHLIVLFRPKGGPLKVVYNGPGKRVWKRCGKMQSNGQRSIGLAKLREQQESVTIDEELKVVRPAPV